MWFGGPRTSAEWHVTMPATATAAVVSSALCVELHAEPVAYSSGAPVQIAANGTFVIEITGNARGQWLPVASHRLVLRASCDTVQVETTAEQLPGFATRSQPRVRVAIEPRGTGCTLRLWANQNDYERLVPVVERTLLLASSHEASGQGLAEPNLSAWRLTRLLVAARDTTDANQRGNLLRRAARQPTAPSQLFRELARIAVSNGQLDDASTYLRRGLLAEPDAHTRAELAALANDVRRRGSGASDLRTQALGRLLLGDPAGAEKLLHSARRTDAQPGVDYHLLAQVHRYRGDQMAALAAQLLAREYDAEAQQQDDADAIAQNRGISDLGRRLSVAAHAGRTSGQLLDPSKVAAVPPR